ncbi:MAG: anti-sigma factor family protein, partial [Pyrinomonadaceae bacterium]
MNCEKCHELLSDFLDGTLPGEAGARLGRHLEECLSCAEVRDELSAIMATARESREQLVAPPDERAMWLRIRGTIEADARARSRAAAAAAGEGFWARLGARRWAMSLPQLASVAAGVAVSVALVTAFGMRALLTHQAEQQQPVRVARHHVQNSDEALMIEYLKQRVEQRRTRWDTHMRQTFDQNMSVIDQTVNEMLNELDERPHDEVSEETLNAAMRDKIELLK